MKIPYLKHVSLALVVIALTGCQPASNDFDSKEESSKPAIETSDQTIDQTIGLKQTDLKKSSPPNPYASYLGKIASELSPPDDISESTRGRPVIDVARDVELRAWAATDPRSGLDEGTRRRLLTESIQLIDSLTAIASASPAGGKGDPNMDRFFLAPLLESILHLRNAQSVSQGKMDQWLSLTRLGVEYQYDEYGENTAVNWDTRLAGGYPNMDAAYVLVMGLAAELYREQKFKDSAETFVTYINENVLSGGSVRYIGDNRAEGLDTNPSPVYTGVVIRFLAKYLTLTGSEKTHALLASLEPHYPMAWVFPGIPENSSAPWWKHVNYTNRLAHAGVFEIIAATAESPTNRAFAQQLIEMGRIDVADALAAVNFYNPDMPSELPPTERVMIDPDIGGFRGVFGDFSWVGSLGPTQDTLMGVMAVTPRLQDGNPSGFDYHSVLLVTPEVGLGSKQKPGKPLFEHAAFATDQSYPGASLIAADQPLAVLGASYQLRQPGIFKPEHPPSNWRSEQVWVFLPDRVLGMAMMHYVGERPEDSSYARTRIRTEHRGGLRPVGKAGAYRNGPLQIKILETTFSKRRHGSAEMNDRRRDPNADEIFLEESPENRLDQHLTVLEIRYGNAPESSGFKRLTHSDLIGFEFTVGTEAYEVFYNPSMQSVAVPNLDKAKIYLGNERAVIAEPLTTSNVSIPSKSVACRVQKLP